MKSNTKTAEFIDEPAIITPDFVRSRVLSPAAGAGLGWERPSNIQVAHDAGKLKGDDPRKRPDARDRLVAGLVLRDLILLSEPSGKDSTDVDRVNKSLGGMPFGECQRVAMRSLARIETSMYFKNWLMVKYVCSDVMTPAQAVKHVCDGFKDTVRHRFNEAMDELILVLAKPERR